MESEKLQTIQHQNNHIILFNDTIGYENVVRLLIENGANINIVDVKNITALMEAAREGIHKSGLKSL